MSWLKNILGIGSSEDSHIQEWIDLFTKGWDGAKESVPKVENIPQQQPQEQTIQPRIPYEDYKKKVSDYYYNVLNNQSPWLAENSDLTDYFPILDDEILKYLYEATMKQRPGVEYLLPIQAMHESTGGRATRGVNNNLFGTLQQGEGSAPIPYESFTQSIDSQLGPNVLGGGANPNMNILNTQEPLTEEEIIRLYESYNPKSSYLKDLIPSWKGMMGK